jgi:HEAT repeat protein
LDELIAQFSAGQRPGGEGMWFVGDNIYSLWSDTRFEDLARLATDVDKGPDRQMIVLGLGRSKRPEAVDVLLSLLDQYSVSGHAAEALAKLRTERARPGLEEMTGDDRDWVVRAAKRGLAALDKAAAEGTP